MLISPETALFCILHDWIFGTLLTMFPQLGGKSFLPAGKLSSYDALNLLCGLGFSPFPSLSLNVLSVKQRKWLAEG